MRIFRYFMALFMLFAWTTSSHAVSIKLDGSGGLTSGTDCQVGAIYRFGTNTSYNGERVDLLVEVIKADNDYDEGTGKYCTYVKDGTLATNLRDTDADDNVAFEEYQITIVKKNTNTAIEVDRVMLTGYDLDTSGNDTDTDDFYVAADGTFISNGSSVTHTSGSFYGSYTEKIKGWDVSNCDDTAATPDATCRASSIWINGNGLNKVSTVKVRVQNDNAYGEYTGDSYQYRLIQLSFQIEDFGPIFNGQKEYGDAPASYGEAGENLDGTIMLGSGLPADYEASYQASSNADSDDVTNKADESAVTIAGTTLSGYSLDAGETITLDVSTFGSGYLQLWCDFNSDGDFEDSGEHVLDSQQITNNGESTDGLSTNTNATSGITITPITLTIPSTVHTGNSFIRVRFSEGNSAGEKDPKSDLSLRGEVEDYKISFRNKGSITGSVKDSHNNPLSAITIKLIQGSFDIATTTTDEQGNYSFSSVDRGDYTIVDTDTIATSITDEDSSDDGDNTSNDNLSDKSIPVTITAGEADNDNNFIHTMPITTGTISGFVEDESASKIAGAIVKLMNATTVVSTVTTLADGAFLFTDIEAGTYTLVESDPSDYLSISDHAGDDNADNTNANDNIIPVTLVAQENDSDNIFVDKYNTGLISGIVTTVDTTPLSKAKIKLVNSDGSDAKDSSGNTLAIITTTDTGTFSFNNLAAGEYRILEVDPSGFVSHSDDAGDDNSANSNTKDNIIPVSLSSGENDTDNHFIDEGYKSISGKVLVDINGDKTGDKGLSSVTINLYSCDTNTFRDTTTDAHGNFHFENLISGCYTLTEIDPEGYHSIKDMDSENDNNISLTLGDSDISDQEFVDEPLLTISGNVKADTNFDESVDVPVNDVRIELFAFDGELLDSVQTDENGEYRFSSVTPGTYTIIETDPQGYSSLRDVDGDNPNTIMITVSQSDILGQNFEDQKRITVSGVVKVDVDGDKIVDEPLKNSTLIICKVIDPCSVDNNIKKITTDDDGAYKFDNLEPGNYKIIEIDKEGYESLGDVDGANDNTIHVHLTNKGDITDQDFDNQAVAPKFVILTKSVAKKQASIGDFVPYSIVIENVNNSYNYAALSIRDVLPAGFKYEKGSARLLRGTSKTALNATGGNTMEFGTFHLQAHEKVTISYLLKVGASVAKGEHINSATANQNGEDVSNTSRASITIIADPFMDNAVIIGKVFEDNNENGIQDKGEKGIPGVRLASVSGMLIETDGYGRYHVADAESSEFGGRGKNYILKVDPATLPQGAIFTTENPRVHRVMVAGLNVIDFGVKLPKVERFSKERIIKKVTLKKELVEVVKEIKIGSIFFDSDQDCIRPNQVKSLCTIAKKIKMYGSGAIIIEGNTDARAPIWYNKKLAYKRAQSVYTELKHQLGDKMIQNVEVIYDNCEREVTFNPKYDWWGKPNIPRTKKECTKFGITKKDCNRLLSHKRGGAL